MPRKIKIPLGDQEVEAIEQDFKVKQEEWNEYELADGGRIRVKTTVLKILRVLDSNGKPAFTPQGDPMVIVQHKSDIASSS